MFGVSAGGMRSMCEVSVRTSAPILTKENIVKIENNVPVPTNWKATVPYQDMKVGDSIFINNGEFSLSLSANMSHYGKRHNMKFARRAVDGGIRIWRIK